MTTNSWWRAIDPFKPAIVVLTVGALCYVLDIGGLRESVHGAGRAVSIGSDYYVAVAVVELAPASPAGGAWDEIRESAPDIFYQIEWQGNRVFQSSTKADTFLAHWSNTAIDLRRLALSGGSTSVDDTIQGARISIRPDDDIRILVFDQDVIRSELAIEMNIRSTDLRLGDNVFEPSPSVRRLVVRVSDMRDPLDTVERPAR